MFKPPKNKRAKNLVKSIYDQKILLFRKQGLVRKEKFKKLSEKDKELNYKEKLQNLGITSSAELSPLLWNGLLNH